MAEPQKIIKKWLPLLIVLEIILLFCILEGHRIYLYFTSSFILGWDATSHFGVALYYSQHIFPAFYGWIPSWFNGMPFPQYYPPIFYYTFALFNHLLPFINPELIFKILALGSFMVCPILLGLIYRKITRGDRVEKAVEGAHLHNKYDWLLVILFSYLAGGLTIYATHLGFGLPSVLESGLIPHAFSIALFLVWLYFMCTFLESRRSRFLAVVFGSLALLTDAHMDYGVLLFYGAFFIKDSIHIYRNSRSWKNVLKKVFLLYVLYGLAMSFIVSFWYLPLIGYYGFNIARSLEFSQGLSKTVFFIFYSYIFLVAVADFILLIRAKKFNAVFALNIAIFAAFSLLLFDFSHFEALPFHVDRLFALIYLIAPIPAISFLSEVRSLNKKIFKWIIIITLVFAVGVAIFTNYKDNFNVSPAAQKANQEVKNLLNQYQNKAFITEITLGYNSIALDLSNYIGNHNNNSDLYNVLRESSVTSIFATPVRNLFSTTPEYWSIRSRLAIDPAYLNKNVESKIEDAKIFGVTNLLINSPKIKNELASSTSVTLATSTSDWNIYDVNYNSANENQYFQILKYKPFLVFADFDVKDFSETKNDFLYLGEELLRYSDQDVHVVNGVMNDVNKINYADFSAAIIEENYGRAHPDLINQIRKNNPDIKILLPDELKNNYSPRPDVSFYESLKEMNNPDRGYTMIKELRPQLISYGSSTPSYQNISFTDRGTKFEISNSNVEGAHLLLKKSFFPTWRTQSGQGIYQINPNFMMVTIPTQKTDIISFFYPQIFYYAHFLALFGLIFLFALYVFL